MNTPISTRWIGVEHTVQAAAYAAGDLIGGKITIPAALSGTNPTAVIAGVKIDDKDGLAVNLNLVIFSADPTATTFTDNGAFTPADADLSKIATIVPITTHYAFANNGISSAENLAHAIRAEKVATTHYGTVGIFGALVATAATTYTTTSALKIWLKVMQD